MTDPAPGPERPARSGAGCAMVGALFGIRSGLRQAAAHALHAASAIEQAISDLNGRLGREGDSRIRIAVTVHAGRAVIGEVGASEPPTMVALGEAVDVANELRRLAAARGRTFAISKPLCAAAGVDPPPGEEVTVRPPASDAPVAASLSQSAPAPPPSAAMLLRERRLALQRLWKG